MNCYQSLKVDQYHFGLNKSIKKNITTYSLDPLETRSTQKNFPKKKKKKKEKILTH